MMETIKDGEDFVKSKRIDKKIVKKERTVKKIEKPKKVKIPKKVAKKVEKKVVKKVEKKVEKKVAKKVATKKKETKKGRPVRQLKAKGAAPIAPADRKLKTKTVSHISEGGPIAGIVDVVFCCDTTGSMCSYLENTKKTIETIMRRIYEKCKPEEVSTRFGFVAYRDHPPQDRTYVTQVHDLNTFDKTLAFIKKQGAAGGGDFPEAVLDGLFDAAKKISWRNSYTEPILRYIFHIADAPPHGKEFYASDPKPAKDYPGPTLEEVAKWINHKEIHYRLIKIGGSLEPMADLFKKAFFNYDDQPINDAKSMDIKVSDMIIRELMPDPDP